MKHTLTNNAHIDYQYETSGRIVNAEAKTNYVTTGVVNASLNIMKTSCKNYFGPNDTITYNIFVSNNALSTAYNVSIIDRLHPCLSYLPGSTTITYSDGNSCKVEESNDVLNKTIPLVGNVILENDSKNSSFGFKIGNLVPNSNAMISFSVSLNKCEELPETIINSATAYYSLTESDSAERTSVESNEICINKAYALITATKSVDKETALYGDSLSYKILINNSGNLDATNLRISDPLPNEFIVDEVKFKIADLPYNISYNIDENNILTIPATQNEVGLCIPANTEDNYIYINGRICEY